MLYGTAEERAMEVPSLRNCKTTILFMQNYKLWISESLYLYNTRH
jgi:hypothetical protein